MEPIILALGSNQGDRRPALNRACVLLERRGIRVLRRSRLYFTRPWGSVGTVPSQPWYLNAAIEARSALRPLELLAQCREVESEMGRIRRKLWDPRILDIDLIFLGNARFDYPDLAIPHPHWSRRDFVIAPLLDLEAVPPGCFAAQARPMLLDLLSRAEPCIESSEAWR